MSTKWFLMNEDEFVLIAIPAIFVSCDESPCINEHGTFSFFVYKILSSLFMSIMFMVLFSANIS